MINTKLSSKIGAALKIEEMSAEQKDEFLVRVGDIIIEASLNRLLSDLKKDEVIQLQADMAKQTEAQDPFAYLLETYPQFETIVEEEIAALQTESEKVLL